MAQDKAWGGEESLTAIAHIFQCDVEIMHELGQTSVIYCGVIPMKIIQMVYRGEPPNWDHYTRSWNHYDSFVHFADDDSPARYNAITGISSVLSLETIDVDMEDEDVIDQPISTRKQMVTYHQHRNKYQNMKHRWIWKQIC